MFQGKNARWNNTRVPPLGSLIHFSGLCHSITAANQVVIELRHIAFNVTPIRPSFLDTLHTPDSSHKRRKFNLYVPADSPFFGMVPLSSPEASPLYVFRSLTFLFITSRFTSYSVVFPRH